ncbi:MAG: HAD family hydrolase [Bacillota bacterium]|nr:HAD family hydrolase [Bacillota bacterium]
MKKEVLLFDVYGTLVDINTLERKKNIWEQVKKEMEKQANRKIRKSAVRIRDLYFSLCQKEEKKNHLEYGEYDEISVFNQLFDLLQLSNVDAKGIARYYREISIEKLELFPNIEMVLAKLKENYTLAILSNAQRMHVEKEIQAILPYFDYVFISGDYGCRIPAKEFYQIALEKISCTTFTMIGDTVENDILPAISLGGKAIQILSPYQEKSSVSLGYVDPFSYEQIFAVLEKKNA